MFQRRRAHSPIERLADNLLRVVGPVPGMLLERLMIVACDAQGRSLIHSAIALEPAARSELEAFGEPTWLVVPNGYHRIDAAEYKRRYPKLVVVSPHGSWARVSKVVAVDQTYEDFGDQGALALEHAPWRDPKEGVLRVRSADGVTLVFNDLLFNPPSQGISGALYRRLGQGPQVSSLAAFMFVDDRVALRACLGGLAQTPGLRRVVPGHGDPITHDAAAVLARAAERA